MNFPRDHRNCLLLGVLAGCDQGGQKRGWGKLVIRMPPWILGCANSRVKR
jgi:hypothetical protein